MYCGERGIRTPGGVTLNGFQDRRIRPLCHFSKKRTLIEFGCKGITFFLFCKEKNTFFHLFLN